MAKIYFDKKTSYEKARKKLLRNYGDFKEQKIDFVFYIFEDCIEIPELEKSDLNSFWNFLAKKTYFLKSRRKYLLEEQKKVLKQKIKEKDFKIKFLKEALKNIDKIDIDNIVYFKYMARDIVCENILYFDVFVYELKHKYFIKNFQNYESFSKEKLKEFLKEYFINNFLGE